ncbi:hypothetical protein SAMN04487820_104338 [Actinopolyspora mzabensis]|uniref:Uncharacterized protein n=1 Tax=Actinopolyspora mzabensis TaxID=995066 RepID=A0A1G8ZAM8_ACTMZ|nr:hypothetical protein [Actinopolyspora mzabensis]SDK12119.1 hypothetical protein SAMN04487820_104338 [Actinopolyspora mzabensis]
METSIQQVEQHCAPVATDTGEPEFNASPWFPPEHPEADEPNVIRGYD